MIKKLMLNCLHIKGMRMTVIVENGKELKWKHGKCTSKHRLNKKFKLKSMFDDIECMVPYRSWNVIALFSQTFPANMDILVLF